MGRARDLSSEGAGFVTAPPLPIDAVIPELLEALATQDRAVLEAEPGAGKTTRVPPGVLTATWCNGEVLVAQPRRLATRQAAERVAQLVGEPLGRTVGYSVRIQMHCV